MRADNGVSFGLTFVDHARHDYYHCLLYPKLRGWGGELTHWQFDTFEAIWRVPGFERNLVTFMLGPNGDVEILRVDGLADFVPVSTSTPTGSK